MITYTLPISPSYVSHWGFWEAVREIIQNAYDQRDSVKGCAASVQYDESHEQLMITTTKGALSRSSLVLGQTTKAGDASQRGKFGEGYKLALLVLTRLGHELMIYSAGEEWTPCIAYSQKYETEILRVQVSKSQRVPRDGVCFIIKGVTPALWELVDDYVTKHYSGAYKENPGRIYVGGLYVCTVEGYEYSYHFEPGVIPLDRDRGMIDDFDLGRATSSYWLKPENIARAYDMIKRQVPDVKYVQHVHTPSVPSYFYSSFLSEHGVDAIPVSNKEEIELATAHGRKCVLVPETLKALIHKVARVFLPSRATPVERLEAILKKYPYLQSDLKDELTDIVRCLK